MIKLIGYAVCLASAIWLILGSLQFRRSIRDDANRVQARMAEFDPDAPGTHGKFLNAYYEDVYRSLPHMILPAVLVVVGATALVISNRKPKTEHQRGG